MPASRCRSHLFPEQPVSRHRNKEETQIFASSFDFTFNQSRRNFVPFKKRTVMLCLVERRELGFHQNTEPKKQQQFYFINDSYWSFGNNLDSNFLF
jgi:hypothetical protein